MHFNHNTTFDRTTARKTASDDNTLLCRAVKNVYHFHKSVYTLLRRQIDKFYSVERNELGVG